VSNDKAEWLMTSNNVEIEKPHIKPGDCALYSTEYTEIHAQRMALIRSYNTWFVVGCLTAFGSFWLMINLGLTIGSMPMLFAAAIVASAVIWFAYRAVLTIDCEVVGHYPRLVFLEILLGYDFYRDYLRRRPRGNSERAFVEQCEQIQADTPEHLWGQIYSHFKHKDFPGKRRVSSHFPRATFLSIVLFWLIVALILVPQYFPWSR